MPLSDYLTAPPTADGRNVSIVHDQLRTAILRGQLAPGRELSQVRLAKSLGVSRTPLREALRMLITEGFVEGEPNRPLRVAGFSISDMEQIYVLRVTLEATAIRLTISRLSAIEIAAMDALLDEMTRFAYDEDYESWEVPHRALHSSFCAHAGERATRLINQLSQHAERYRRAYTTNAARAWTAGLVEHGGIIDACRTGDPDRGAKALAEHLGHTALGLIELEEPAHDGAALKMAIAAASVAIPTLAG